MSINLSFAKPACKPSIKSRSRFVQQIIFLPKVTPATAEIMLFVKQEVL